MARGRRVSATPRRRPRRRNGIDASFIRSHLIAVTYRARRRATSVPSGPPAPGGPTRPDHAFTAESRYAAVPIEPSARSRRGYPPRHTGLPNQALDRCGTPTGLATRQRPDPSPWQRTYRNMANRRGEAVDGVAAANRRLRPKFDLSPPSQPSTAFEPTYAPRPAATRGRPHRPHPHRRPDLRDDPLRPQRSRHSACRNRSRGDRSGAG